MSNFGERVLEKLHLRRHIEKVEVDAPGAEVKIKEHPVDQVTPPVSEPADNPKVKVHVKGAPGVKEKVKVKEVAPGEYLIEEKVKGPDGKIHIKTRVPTAAELPPGGRAAPAAEAHAPGNAVGPSRTQGKKDSNAKIWPGTKTELHTCNCFTGTTAERATCIEGQMPSFIHSLHAFQSADQACMCMLVTPLAIPRHGLPTPEPACAKDAAEPDALWA